MYFECEVDLSLIPKEKVIELLDNNQTNEYPTFITKTAPNIASVSLFDIIGYVAGYVIKEDKLFLCIPMSFKVISNETILKPHLFGCLLDNLSLYLVCFYINE